MQNYKKLEQECKNEVYFGKQLLPVAPESLELKIKNQNRTMTLADGMEINILKFPGLTDITFDLRLPIYKYHWANYGGAADQVKFLNMFEEYKSKKAIFDFVVLRNRSDYTTHKNAVFTTSIKVSLEDYTIKESFDEGGDVIVSINLKQYRTYNITVGYSSRKQKVSNDLQIYAASTYVTQRGDTLDSIVTRFYEIDNAVRVRALTSVYNANKTTLQAYGLTVRQGTVFGVLTPLGGGLALTLPAVM